jgi:hypothetical protein
MSTVEKQGVEATAERLEELREHYESAWKGKPTQHSRRVLAHLRAIAELRYGCVFTYDAHNDVLDIVPQPWRAD